MRKLQRLERNSPKLNKVPDNYLSALADLVKKAKQSFDKSGSREDMRMLENVLEVARDIYNRREQKIIMKALADARTSTDDSSNMLPEEQNLYFRIKEALKDSRSDFSVILAGKTPKKAETNVLNEKLGDEIAKEDKQEDLNIILVRTIKKVPKFVGSDLKEYGPYEANELVNIPKKEAELLSKQGFIEII